MPPIILDTYHKIFRCGHNQPSCEVHSSLPSIDGHLSNTEHVSTAEELVKPSFIKRRRKTPQYSEEEKKSIVEQSLALRPWFHYTFIDDDCEILRCDADGTAMPGPHYPYTYWHEVVENFLPQDFTGLHVLDIGCNSGFFSYQCKDRGAERVVGIDWAEENINRAKYVHKYLAPDLDIEFRTLDVYDLHRDFGLFDVVLFFGVLYHCKHPLLALERIAEVCRGSVYVNTLILPDEMTLSTTWGGGVGKIMKFLEFDEIDNIDNWWMADQLTVEGMMRTAGFSNVRKLFYVPPERHGRPAVSLTMGEKEKD